MSQLTEQIQAMEHVVAMADKLIAHTDTDAEGNEVVRRGDGLHLAAALAEYERLAGEPTP